MLEDLQTADTQDSKVLFYSEGTYSHFLTAEKEYNSTKQRPSNGLKLGRRCPGDTQRIPSRESTVHRHGLF